MGGCIATPAKVGAFKRRNDSSNPVPEYRSDPSRVSRLISVLHNPAGGDILHKYRFGKELGRGEFGITRKCFDLQTGEALACKTIPKSKLRTEIDIEDVRREVDIMHHLPKHPNIVCFKEAYEDKEAVYLVMELCEGGELFDRIVARGHYTERAAATVTKTIIEICKVNLFHFYSFLFCFFFFCYYYFLN